MYVHKELPEAVRKTITRWYQVSACLISIVLFTLAGIQWYTWYTLRKFQQKIAVHQLTMSTVRQPRHMSSPQEKIALARLFAEVCNRTPRDITLTKLVINPAQHIVCHGVSTDQYAMTQFISQLSELGFSHVVRMNTHANTGSATAFELCCALNIPTSR
jgi:hypothetical protein